MKYDIYLYEIVENGKVCGLWWERAEFEKIFSEMQKRWYVDKNCKVPATSENIWHF